MTENDTYYSLFFKKFEEKLKAHAKGMALDLGQGKAESYGDYKYSCGIIAGLNQSLNVLDDVLREIKEEEET